MCDKLVILNNAWAKNLDELGLIKVERSFVRIQVPLYMYIMLYNLFQS